ncbi:MAG TPA: DUF99 family protein [Burkholderiales bacterium]|nr:DUF99 family protein [Burkholderiales bacterium]
MSTPRWSHVVGFDDAPFPRQHRGDVLVVGAVFAGTRLDGVLSCKVRRDGANATERLVECVRASRFYPQLHAVLLQGITLAGFNVVDIARMDEALVRPVVVVSRRRPDLVAIRDALLRHVPGGSRKWRLIEKAGAMERIEGVYVQRSGISREELARLQRMHVRNGRMPEPLRAAHLIAGGMILGESSGRP